MSDFGYIILVTQVSARVRLNPINDRAIFAEPYFFQYFDYSIRSFDVLCYSSDMTAPQHIIIPTSLLLHMSSSSHRQVKSFSKKLFQNFTASYQTL